VTRKVVGVFVLCAASLYARPGCEIPEKVGNLLTYPTKALPSVF
jgi:hypothetical protein